MPELGAAKEALLPDALSKLDEYLEALTDESKRAAALAMRNALLAWTSPELTEEITETAQAMLVAEGYGDERRRLRMRGAWLMVMDMINALAHPEAHPTWRVDAAMVLPKLDAYLAFLTEEDRRPAALAMREALAAWTSGDVPEAIKEAAQAMLIVEDYAGFQAALSEFLEPIRERARIENERRARLRDRLP